MILIAAINFNVAHLANGTNMNINCHGSNSASAYTDLTNSTTNLTLLGAYNMSSTNGALTVTYTAVNMFIS